VWRALEKRSFAVLGYRTPSGDPRSSGVVYKALGRKLYVAVAPDSWKAKHIGASGRIAVTVPIRRGGLLSLALPIPPATVSFHGRASVYATNSTEGASVVPRLGSLLPPERRASAVVIEITAQGTFVTYGVGVSLRDMRNSALARARVPVS
jgi:Pyridoxamine 5'-phosphate oxidase